MSEPDDDDRLAIRSRKGDALALAELYRRHAPALLRYLERQVGCRAEAEDLLQESFVRIFEGRGRYDCRGRFRAWLFTIGTRLLVDRARQRRRHEELLQADTRAAADAEPPAVIGGQTLARIESVLADLPRDYAVAFHLRVREDFSYAEMAAICGDPEGTLRSRVHHTIRRVRAALAPELDGAPPDGGTARAAPRQPEARGAAHGGSHREGDSE